MDTKAHLCLICGTPKVELPHGWACINCDTGRNNVHKSKIAEIIDDAMKTYGDKEKVETQHGMLSAMAGEIVSLRKNMARQEIALRMAMRGILGERIECPRGEYDWSHPSTCADVCKADGMRDKALCWITWAQDRRETSHDNEVLTKDIYDILNECYGEDFIKKGIVVKWINGEIRAEGIPHKANHEDGQE